jgi:hypothetical protein
MHSQRRKVKVWNRSKMQTGRPIGRPVAGRKKRTEISLVMLAEVEYLCVHNVAANFQDCDSVTKGWCDFDVNMRIATGRNRFGAKQFTDLAIAVVTDLNSAVRFGNNQAEFNFCVALL